MDRRASDLPASNAEVRQHVDERSITERFGHIESPSVDGLASTSIDVAEQCFPIRGRPELLIAAPFLRPWRELVQRDSLLGEILREVIQ